MSKLVTPDRSLVIPQALSHSIGLNAALLLQQIHYWQQRGELKEDGFKWFYKTFKQWTQELPLSMRAVTAAIKKLKALGLIEVERKSAKTYYQANWYRVVKEAVAELWQSINPNQTHRCDRSDRIDAIASDISPTKSTPQETNSTNTPPQPPQENVVAENDKNYEPTPEELNNALNQLKQCHVNPNAVRRELLKQFANFQGAITRTKEALSQGWCNNPTGVFKKALKLGLSPDSQVLREEKKNTCPPVPAGFEEWCKAHPEVKTAWYSEPFGEWVAVFETGLQRPWHEVMEDANGS